ncbi:RNA-binding domain-containing protein [Mycobacterium intracellulare]|uniref:RNA-binding domain-containing protein n=1 Tax=Mycobacterium intracellulare TaxID=1767 RepID=UPI00191655F0|nr:RNA-binding domain-containing protein [Mycobacterium intracellulare]BCO71141.1 transcriptional regulator [Mycobacterium intracellulare]BCO76692.1 transcriptional regulator [Mycobacterium intracellulare]BCP40382.1 transcriptional regulator [Mycobacterium intracellulare]
MAASEDTAADFEGLIERLRAQPRESEWLEFKQNLADPDEIGQYVSALSNSAALHGEAKGYLVWGVEDESHKLVGTVFDLNTAKKGNQALHPWLLAALTPDPGIMFRTGLIRGHRVAILEIPAATHHPIQFKGTAYIRIGSHKKKLQEHPVQAKQLYKNLDETPFEFRIASAGLTEDEALETLNFGVYFRLQGDPIPQSRAQILAALASDQVIAQQPSGRYAITNLGALLFAHRIEDFPTLQRKAPRVIKYKGSNKAVAEREQIGTMGYACAFEGLVGFIDNLLPRNEVIHRALRTTVSMYPELAVREIVANALVHQDFSVSGTGPLFELYDDRVEFTNPGTPLVDPARFVDAPPRSRNEKLAALMRRCKICEERGSGWDRIGFEIEFHQLPAPLIRVAEGHISVTLFAHRSVKAMDRDDRIRAVYLHACLQYVSHKRLTNSSLRERFGLSDRDSSTASSYIREAVDAGLIVIHDPTVGRKLAQYVPIWAKAD